MSKRARCRLHHISRSRHHDWLAQSVDPSSVSALVLGEPGPASGYLRMPGNYTEHLAICGGDGSEHWPPLLVLSGLNSSCLCRPADASAQLHPAWLHPSTSLHMTDQDKEPVHQHEGPRTSYAHIHSTRATQASRAAHEARTRTRHELHACCARCARRGLSPSTGCMRPLRSQFCQNSTAGKLRGIKGLSIHAR